VPPDPQIDGIAVHFSWVAYEPSAQSGVGHVGNHTSTVIQ
jgi:hypothetical protein